MCIKKMFIILKECQSCISKMLTKHFENIQNLHRENVEYVHSLHLALPVSSNPDATGWRR